MSKEKYEISEIHEPKIVGTKRSGMQPALRSNSHLLLQNQEYGITILVPQGKSQIKSVEIARKGLMAMLNEIKAEEYRNSDEYKNIVKD